MKRHRTRIIVFLLIFTLMLSAATLPAKTVSAASLNKVEFTRTDTEVSYIYVGSSDYVLLSNIFRMMGLKGKTADGTPVFDPDDAGFTAEADGSDWKISHGGQLGDNWSCIMTVRVSDKAYQFRMNRAAENGGTWKNKDGTEMSWSFAEGTLTLSGAGNLNRPGQDDDFGLDKTMGNSEADWIPEVPWKAVIPEIQKVVIGSEITSIGAHAFRKHTALKEVTVGGNSLTKIGKGAFYGCTALETLDLRQCTSLTDIGQNANAADAPFLYSGLKTILLSPSVTSLPKSMFHWKNSSLQKVNLSALVNLTSIEEEAFKKEDTSQPITDSVVEGGLNLDNQTKLETIGKNAFRNQTGLNPKLVIGSPVLTSIADGAFSAWKKDLAILESVDLSACKALETVGKEAFLYQTKLTSIKFADAFTWVDKDAFKNCTGLSLPTASIAYCAGSGGALYNVNADGTAALAHNATDGTVPDTLYWIPTAIGDDPTAAAVTIPYSSTEQALVNGPELCPETLAYAISYTLDGGSGSSEIPKAKDPGTYTVGYTVTLPDGTTQKTGTITVTIAKPITKSMLSLDAESFEYDAGNHAPELTVKDGDTPLTKDTDYTVDQSSVTTAKDVGDYTITVNGQGGYSGTASIGWSIVDTTAPAISDVTNGETYQDAVSFEATDLRLDTVTLQKDSETAQPLTVTNGKASGSASEPGSYTLTAKDLSGNETAVSFTIEAPVYSVTADSDTEWTQGSGADVTITVKRSFGDDSCFSHFDKVLVDGTALGGSDYTAASGSTVVTLKASYLESLSVGTHTVKVSFNDGEAETQLTVKAAETTAAETTEAETTEAETTVADTTEAETTAAETTEAVTTEEETSAAETTEAETTEAETTAAETAAEESTEAETTPNTGDSVRPGFWIALLALSLAALVAMTVLGRKRRSC